MTARTSLRRVFTTSDVMNALGGPAGVSTLTGAPYKRVWDWQAAERFPARYFLVMWTELINRGCFAPPKLWGQAEAPRERVAWLRTAVHKRGIAA